MKFHRDPKLALLRRLPLFADCSPTELREVAAIADEIWLPAGTRLTTEGASGEEFVVLVAGTAAVHKGDTTVATLGPGDFVGEIALLTGRPRSATVVATSAVVVLVVPRHRFLTLVDRLPELRARLDAVVPLRDAS